MLRVASVRRLINAMEKTGQSKQEIHHSDEHILVCLSSSPSNAKLIRTAARMAEAFRGAFTALFVETPDFSAMGEEDVRRLQANMRLARQLGAKIETVHGEDVSFQIAEFARLSGVSKIVIGRSAATRRGLFRRPSLTEKLIDIAPNLDVHIIPDAISSGTDYRPRSAGRKGQALSPADVIKSLLILGAATLVGQLFYRLSFDDANIITVYLLGVLIISVVTSNRTCSLVSSVVSVFVFNFFFTDPRFTLHAYDRGYPATFVIMFLAAFLTSSLALRLKNQAGLAAQAAYRTKLLFDTNQLMQQAGEKNAILSAAAGQILKLFGRGVIVYPEEKGSLGEPVVFADGGEIIPEACTGAGERAVAEWTFQNNKHAGATTDTMPDARCLYLAIRVNDHVYGVVGIVVGEKEPDAFESSILLSILGECALALENVKNAAEKEEAAILAQNERLRANLLRAISHDLRTPLTAISGNAGNLLSNGISFDEETKRQLYKDIYEDSLWLINLVENLLSVTRLEEGRLNLNMTEELMDDVMEEALRHVNRLDHSHEITVYAQEEFLLARMDARLIVQVFINLLDNAIKYTPKGSHIAIHTRKEQQMAVVSIADDGPGIPKEAKAHVFDMFYTGANRIADSRRSLGLGLALCKSIIHAHGGTILVRDNRPAGTEFIFTLPCGEVNIHE